MSENDRRPDVAELQRQSQQHHAREQLHDRMAMRRVPADDVIPNLDEMETTMTEDAPTFRELLTNHARAMGWSLDELLDATRDDIGRNRLGRTAELDQLQARRDEITSAMDSLRPPDGPAA